ncbi:unnamed protein product [Mytilus coruscus]|uniref:Uncharacterized protein n=1 Tax=Mytilus coruscus TaxID=42192 RepID=A0A6J8AYX7_MYTCO|nr:unnamed protein product [Mytilus coruscus]
MKYPKLKLCVEDIPLQPDNSALFESVKNLIKTEVSKYQTSFEKNVVNLVENVIGNVTLLSDKINTVNQILTETKTYVQKAKSEYKPNNNNNENVKMDELVMLISSIQNKEDQSKIISSLEENINDLKLTINTMKHENLLSETTLKSLYEAEKKSNATYKEQTDKHIKFLTNELENKESLVEQTLKQQSESTKKDEILQKEIDCAKEELSSLKIHITEHQQNFDTDSWSKINPISKQKDKKPQVLLIGTSNISKIDPEKLSSKYETTKETAFKFNEAEQVIQNLGTSENPEVIVFHVLTNELMHSTSSECVTKMQKLVNETKTRKPSSKILISLATNRTDEKKLNLRVNTINSAINELAEESKEFDFQQALQLPSVTSQLDQFVHNNVYSLDQDGIDIAVNDFQSCINEAANIALKQRKVKVTGKKKKDKPWYNTLLHDLKKSLDHYSRVLALNPFNKELRAKCFHLSKTYNKTRKEKRRNYFKDLMVKLKNTSQSNPKAFWDIINTLKSSDQENKESGIDTESWLLHFKELNTECSIPIPTTSLFMDSIPGSANR